MVGTNYPRQSLAFVIAMERPESKRADTAMPSLYVNHKSERRRSAGANRDMERDIGISRDTAGSQNIYSAVVVTAPGGKTDVHHHAECETAIFILNQRKQNAGN